MLEFLKRKKAPKEEGTIQQSGFLNSADYDSLKSAFGMYTGSTIPGTMSLPRPWRLDYYALRERSWQAYTENELASAFIDRLRHFVVNTGLKFNYEPSKLLTENLGVELTDDDRQWVERDFAVYASSKAASLSGEHDLHSMADQAYMNMCLAGDLLVVLHVVNGEIRVQHIDGRNIIDPWDRGTLLSAAKKRNTISNGVEYDKRGREVAYYVRQDNYFAATASAGKIADRLRTERVPAYGKSGRRIAFRPSRDNQRVGSGRGKPLLTSTLQNLEVTRRYKLAELLAAEVNAMIVWSIEHDELSFGENPLQNLPNGGGRHTTGQAQELAGGWSADNGDKIAGRVTQATTGMAVNMGRGQKLKVTDTKRPNVQGAEFVASMNVDTSAAAGIPYEIARMLFTSSYSASRAALGMFELIVNFERKSLTDQYYSVIARERQRLRSLQGKIPAPKQYTSAIIQRDEFMLSAFEGYRYTGVVMPDVDPLKEVKAARERIAARLTTHAKETENLGTGDFENNANALSKEMELLDSLNLVVDTLEEENETEGPDAPAKNEE